MTKCKKMFLLLTLVALLAFPKGPLANESTDEYAGNVSLELISGTVESTTESIELIDNTVKETPKKNLPRTGETVQFLSGLLGVLLLGVGGFLLIKRKKEATRGE